MQFYLKLNETQTRVHDCVFVRQSDKEIVLAVKGFYKDNWWEWFTKHADYSLVLKYSEGIEATLSEYRIKHIEKVSDINEYWKLRFMWEEVFKYYYPLGFVLVVVEF